MLLTNTSDPAQQRKQTIVTTTDQVSTGAMPVPRLWTLHISEKSSRKRSCASSVLAQDTQLLTASHEAVISALEDALPVWTYLPNPHVN